MRKDEILALYMMTNNGKTISIKELADYAKSVNDKKWIANKLVAIEKNTIPHRSRDFAQDLGANVLGNILTDSAISIFKRCFR